MQHFNMTPTGYEASSAAAVMETFRGQVEDSATKSSYVVAPFEQYPTIAASWVYKYIYI